MLQIAVSVGPLGHADVDHIALALQSWNRILGAQDVHNSPIEVRRLLAVGPLEGVHICSVDLLWQDPEGIKLCVEIVSRDQHSRSPSKDLGYEELIRGLEKPHDQITPWSSCVVGRHWIIEALGPAGGFAPKPVDGVSSLIQVQ